MEGVNWAAVNGVAGRLIVQFDADQLDIGDLLDVVTTIEEAHGANDERFSHDRTEHPGDGESVRRSAIELAADVAGIGASFTGMLLRATPLPIELAAIASWVEDQPRVRRELDNRLGPVVTDIGVSVTNVVGNALAQGPLGLVVDGARRTTALLAARARRDTWIKQEESLAGRPETASAPTVARAARPVPLPRGPVEDYMNRAAVASLAGGAISLAFTRAPRRAGAVMIAGASKPTRLGREVFVAHLERLLARRGVVVFDESALLRVDRVDCLLLAEDLVLTGGRQPRRVVIAAGEDRSQVQRRVRRLFRPHHPDRPHREKGWVVGPIDKLSNRTSPDAVGLAAKLSPPARFGVAHDNTLVGVGRHRAGSPCRSARAGRGEPQEWPVTTLKPTRLLRAYPYVPTQSVRSCLPRTQPKQASDRTLEVALGAPVGCHFTYLRSTLSQGRGER